MQSTDKTQSNPLPTDIPVDPAARQEPPADCFRVGDTWENSRGTRHQVLKVERGVAHMINERTQRTYNRPWDDLGWKSGRPWVRISCGFSKQCQ